MKKTYFNHDSVARLDIRVIKLRSVIEDFDLFVIEDGCFYSRRLNNHIEQINTKSIKAKENANKRWNNATAMLVK